MADRIDDLNERVARVETAIETLAREVSEGFSEQAAYTGDAYLKLDAKMDAGFNGMKTEFDGMKTEFNGVKAKFEGMNAKMDAGFGRLERKLDQFIETQIQTNQIVDRRLRQVEE